MFKRRKINTRRQQVRAQVLAGRLEKTRHFINSPLPAAIAVLVLFVGLSTIILSLDLSPQGIAGNIWKPPGQMFFLAVLVSLISLGGAMYVYQYSRPVIQKPARMITLVVLFLLMLSASRIGWGYGGRGYLAVGSAIVCAVILTIAYDGRFSLSMTFFYSAIACFAAEDIATLGLFLTMMAGVLSCCFSLKEIRTRMKIIEVGTLAAVAVFVSSAAMELIQKKPITETLEHSGISAGVVLGVGVLIQGFLPMIERLFGLATSMTLMDYSDASQPLLRRLAMEAPGTYSHSLLIGAVAETAAQAVGANGLLCRVGSYYHDIGKINKPPYFIENQFGPVSRHEQLSPAMSQLVIVGHVKDGIEIAREYGLPVVLWQFIETHHGTTLIEYFYNEALKKQNDRPVSDTEFRYPGPKPQTKEAAIVMLVDTIEGAVRSLSELTPTKIETTVHNMAMKRLQDGQLDNCDLTLRELSKIEQSISKTLAAHYHGRIAYPKSPDQPLELVRQKEPI